MMKTLRDKILNPYSAIIYICLSVIMLSCKKLGEPVKHAKYIIINKTQHDITFKPEFSVNKLGANEVLERVLTTDADSYDEAPTDYF